MNGSTLTVTFTQEVNGAVSIHLGLTANFTNAQKSLSDIQTAVSSGKAPGLKTITATETKKSDGTTYESSLDIEAELSPYSVPIGINDFRVFSTASPSGSYVQNRDYTFNNGSNKSVSASDGLAHPILSNWTIAPAVITDIPGGFVLTGGTGWTQTGTTLTYDGTGNGQFTGHFTGSAGSYSVPVGSLTATSYYAYDATPVVISNTVASNFQIIAPTPLKPPTLSIANSQNEIIYKIDPSQLFGRTIPENVEEASFTAVLSTNDPTLVTPGDNNIASAHWQIDNQKAPHLTYIKSFTVPAEATNGAVITFNDGTTKTYPAGTAVSYDDPESNYVTKIVMDFDALPSNTAISMPFKYYFADTSATKLNQGLNQTLTGTYTNYGGVFNPGGTHAYGPGLYVYTGLNSGTTLSFNSQNLQYADSAGTYQIGTIGGTRGDLLGDSRIYEPVSYVVLPQGIDYQGVTGGLSGYKASAYTISTGQTVVKIDYTGSGQLVGASKSDWPMINYRPKTYGLPRTSTVWSYISTKNDPAMTLQPDVYGTKQPAGASLEAEITQGDTEAIFSSSANVSIDGTKYLTGASSITNNVGVTGQNAVNDYVNGVNHSLVLDLLNSTETDAGVFRTLTNLPGSSDGLTLNLTGPGKLRNLVSGESVTDSKIGQILYSTSRQDLTNGQTIDKSGYLTANQVTDWSKIQSFIVEIEAMNSESEYTAELSLTAPDAIHQLNKTVTITSHAQTNVFDTEMTSTDEFISSVAVVHGTVHYEANFGNTSSLPADQTTEDFLETSTEKHSVTLSNTRPTKDKDAYYTYDFSEWNTRDDGTGAAYQPGETINQIAGGETVTLYAQWRQNPIPTVTAKLHYDANGGDTSSLPADETISFQPGQTGETTVSPTIPTRAGDDRTSYTFMGWNTYPDGSGASYQAGEPIRDLNAGSTTTLYAQWGETLKTSTVTTHFIDTDGNTIAADVVTSGTIDSAYQTQGLSGDALINGDITYKLTETPANAAGVYTPQGITVTYVYSLSKSSVDNPIAASTVTVHYVDTDGNTIAPNVVTTGEVGHAYTTKELTGDALINGDITYKLTETPTNASGVYSSNGNITVTYVYSLSKSSVDNPIAASTVIVHYVDTDGNTIAPEVVTTGEVGHAYTTKELTGDALINGDITYKLTKTPSNAAGVYSSDGNIIVTYVYTAIKASLPPLPPDKPEEPGPTPESKPKPEPSSPPESKPENKKTAPPVTNTSASAEKTSKGQILPKTGERNSDEILSSGIALLSLAGIIELFRRFRKKSNNS